MSRTPHKILGTARCLRCDSPTRNVSQDLCLPCLLDLEHIPHADFAVDCTMHPNNPMCLRSICSFARQLPVLPQPRLNSILLNLKPSIIKVCELCEQRVAAVEAQGLYPNPIQCITQPESCEQFALRVKPNFIDKIKTELYTSKQGTCDYCKKIFTFACLQLDVVIPAPFIHSHGYDNPGNYYRAMHNLGNVRLACGHCNKLKGVPEASGRNIMRNISSGFCASEQAHPYLVGGYTPQPHRFYYPDFARQFQATHSRKDKSAPIPDDLKYEFAGVIALFSIRVVNYCQHLSDFYFLTYNPELRTIEIGCSGCVRQNQLLAINVRKLQKNRLKSYERKIQKTPKKRHLGRSPLNPAAETEPEAGTHASKPENN